MNRTQTALSLTVAAALLAGGGYEVGRRSHTVVEPAGPGAAGTSASAPRKVLYWHDPMVPGPRFDKPGKSPFMDMQLVPMYADQAGDSGVKVSSSVRQSLGIRTAAVKRTDVSSSFDAIGTVQFNERLSVAVQTRVAGYVEHLAVRAPMERVRPGQALATVYAPEWLGPQNEWLALKRAGVSPDLVAAARDRMGALSIPEALIRRTAETGTAQARFILSAPIGGVVAELGVREGVAISPGMTLFRIAGLEKVWAVAEVPEAQVIHLSRGQKVRAVLQADPSRSFEGEMREILPQVSADTRTLQARFEVDNKGGRLTPGMLLRLQIAGPTRSRLVVPAEAVIRTGSRAVAIVHKGDGSFEPRDVQLGSDLGDSLEIVQGLAEGEEVVASGQFLIDSEARLKSVLGAMAAAAPASSTAVSASMPAIVHVGEGKVESVGADGITISHGPVATLQWPAMTMRFGKPHARSFPDIKKGDAVRFEFREGGANDYVIVSMQRIGGAR